MAEAIEARTGNRSAGTIFFSSLSHSGFVEALSHCLLVELASTPVLFALTRTLPPRPRDTEVAPVTSGAPASAPEPAPALARALAGER